MSMDVRLCISVVMAVTMVTMIADVRFRVFADVDVKLYRVQAFVAYENSA